MTFEIEQESFKGPLLVLLELLSNKKLEIKDVSLAKIADDYLVYLDENDVPIEYTADFLVIATRLIYIKSCELMPFLHIDEEDEQIEQLEDQLRLYRLFVQASERLRESFENDEKVFSRPLTRLPVEMAFRPAQNCTQNSLAAAFINVLKRLEPFFALSRVSMERVKSVEERLTELKDVIATRVTMRFRDIAFSAQRKVDIVVSFLALLELVRRRMVTIKQADRDIIIERL